MKQKGFAPVLIILVVTILGIVGYIVFFQTIPGRRICTQEARICPDGSSVQRSGPKCEFAACPSPSSVSSSPLPSPKATIESSKTINGWKVFTGQYYSISFPSNWVLKGPWISQETGFAQDIQLMSPRKTSAIKIGAKYDFPFGFGNAEQSTKTVEVKIGNTNYSGTETRYSTQNSSIFTIIETPNITVSVANTGDGKSRKLPLLFMFGNDYPLGGSLDFKQTDPVTKLNQYLEDQTAIYQILSTFKFTQ